MALTSLSASSDSGTDQLTPSNYAEPVILDSGTTNTLLPNDIVSVVFEELGAEASEEFGVVIVPCALANKTGSLSYGFGGVGGPNIQVNVSQLVSPLANTNGNNVPTYPNGQTICELSIEAAGSRSVLFGDTFLRSAYVVYDLVNNRIAIAETNFNSTESNVVAFESAGANIPSATSAPSEAAVTLATATGTGDVTIPTGTVLSAAAGFTGTGTATGAAASSSKKSNGPASSAPFQWSVVMVGAVTILGLGVGGGGFALL